MKFFEDYHLELLTLEKAKNSNKCNFKTADCDPDSCQPGVCDPDENCQPNSPIDCGPDCVPNTACNPSDCGPTDAECTPDDLSVRKS